MRQLQKQRAYLKKYSSSKDKNTIKTVNKVKSKHSDLTKKVNAYQVSTFKGYEKDYYQQHDDLIMTEVRNFNNDIKTGIGGTDAQAEGVRAKGYLRANIVKSKMIQENGAYAKKFVDNLNGSYNKRTEWRTIKSMRFLKKDPLTVNHAAVNGVSDWSKYKVDLLSDYEEKLRLKENKKAMYPTGQLETNLIAGIRWLARKGFGSSGQPMRRRPTGTFDGWKKAIDRFGPGNKEYSERIMDRANNPDKHVPIQ